MNDTINRRDAIDAMTNTLWHYPNECYRNLNEYEFAKGLAELGLKSVPSAQPERKRGRWTLIGMKKYKTVGRTPDQKEVLLEKEWRREEKIQCSCCGEITMLDYSITYQFCPHCGADMREDNHETD